MTATAATAGTHRHSPNTVYLGRQRAGRSVRIPCKRQVAGSNPAGGSRFPRSRHSDAAPSMFVSDSDGEDATADGRDLVLSSRGSGDGCYSSSTQLRLLPDLVLAQGRDTGRAVGHVRTKSSVLGGTKRNPPATRCAVWTTSGAFDPVTGARSYPSPSSPPPSPPHVELGFAGAET